MASKQTICLCTPQRYAPDWEQQRQRYQRACEARGFALLEPACAGQRVEDDFHSWMETVRRCDILVGDMNNFRGWEPDSGACFVLGAGYVWGKKIYLYLDDLRSCAENFTEEKYQDEPGEQIDITAPENQNKGTVSKGWRDKEGIVLENGPLNLMMSAHAPMVEGGFEEALERIQQDEEGGAHRCL